MRRIVRTRADDLRDLVLHESDVVKTAPTQPTATIVAFDGLVADTRAARALAVSQAVSAEIGPCTPDEAMALVDGRSIDDSVEAALRARSSSPQRAGAIGRHIDIDHTLRDLAVLRARRGFSAMVAQGLPLREGAVAWIAARAASHGRVVLRAESARRDVDQLIAFAGIEDIVAFIRCSDDLPRTFGASSVESGWSAVVNRLAAQRIALDRCVAFECSDAGVVAARKFLTDVWQIDSLT